MKINDSKRRRMYIMQQIADRQHSREQNRKSSAQRRKKIQKDLNDFVKTMSNISHNYRTGDSEVFRNTTDNNYNKASKQSFNRRPNSYLKQEYDNLLKSPSFQNIVVNNNQQIKDDNDEYYDIQSSIKNPSKLGLNQDNIVKKHNQSIHQSQQFNNINTNRSNKQQKQIQAEEIKYNQSQKYTLRSSIKKQQTSPKAVQNQSSASGIFFTSKFNDFINNNHYPNIYQQTPQKQQDQVKQPQNKNINSPQGKIIQSPNLITHQNDPISDHISQQPQQNKQQKQRQKDSRLLIKNKSNASLAISNQSSLKYSLYESNFKQIINQKLTNQLIVDTNQFNQINQNQNSKRNYTQPNARQLLNVQNDDSMVYINIKIQMLAENALKKQYIKVYRDFLAFSKLYRLSQKINRRNKQEYFDAFLINQQLNFIQRKNQIKCDNYLKNKQQKLVKNIFKLFKQQFFILPLLRIEKADLFKQQKEKNLKQKVYRHFKISWFDQKVKKQIQLYYLSKIFTHFVKAVKNQKQVMRNKCLSHYCMNLKKQFFKHLIEGTTKLQNQRIQSQNASWHYAFNLQRKVFNAWRQRLSYKDRYISLAMTTKNTFKQTNNQKWLQIKTVDFKQIKN